jgi:Phosphodiester glycosidase
MIIRDGANYVNASLQFQTGTARAAIGYTANGSLLLVQLEGDLPTLTKSATAGNVTAVSTGNGLGVYEFADLLVELGAGNLKFVC